MMMMMAAAAAVLVVPAAVVPGDGGGGGAHLSASGSPDVRSYPSFDFHGKQLPLKPPSHKRKMLISLVAMIL